MAESSARAQKVGGQSGTTSGRTHGRTARRVAASPHLTPPCCYHGLGSIPNPNPKPAHLADRLVLLGGRRRSGCRRGAAVDEGCHILVECRVQDACTGGRRNAGERGARMSVLLLSKDAPYCGLADCLSAQPVTIVPQNNRHVYSTAPHTRKRVQLVHPQPPRCKPCRHQPFTPEQEGGPRQFAPGGASILSSPAFANHCTPKSRHQDSSAHPAARPSCPRPSAAP